MSNIESLLMSFQKSSIDVETLMTSIINNYELNVNGKIYHFCEIELYYQASNHKDCIVLSRHKNVGDIFFHRYGFDICFASKKNNDGDVEYGGILVRSLKKDDKYILGPLRCSHRLLNENQPKISISIQEKIPKNQEIIYKTKRVKAPCKKDKHTDYNEALYRYVTKGACNDKEYLTKIQEKICNGEKKANND
jgi:hypothetical protein